MTKRSLRAIAVACSCLLTGIAMLVPASSALAVQTDRYDAFSRCPTGAPGLNDPSQEFAVCSVVDSPNGVLKIGSQPIPISQFNLQFGMLGFGPAEPDCPMPQACFGRVPGTTSLVSSPSSFVVHSDTKAPGPQGNVKLKVTVEAAGDVRAVSPGFLFEMPIPTYKLPIKLHVEAPWLGDHCYLGSEEDPIFLGPFVTGPPAEFQFETDPNGYKVEILRFVDMPLADPTIAIPGAEGCGNSRGRGHGSDRWKNDVVEGLLGLPSPAGANQVLFPHSEVAFAAASFDGVAPDGGAELQAAFDAAH